MTDTEAVLRLFDELAGEYDQHIPFFAPFGRDLTSSTIPSRSLLRPAGCSALAACWRSPRRDRGSRPDSRWDFDELVRDADERASEERKRRSSEETAPELFTPPPRALPEICAAVGFTELSIAPSSAPSTSATRSITGTS